jgi:hypothetical protein
MQGERELPNRNGEGDPFPCTFDWELHSYRAHPTWLFTRDCHFPKVSCWGIAGATALPRFTN